MQYIRKENLTMLAEQIKTDFSHLEDFEFIYADSFPCRVEIYNDLPYYVTDSIFEKEAVKNGFTKTENGNYRKDAEKYILDGYRNFGTADLGNGEKAFWACKASSGEDKKLPSMLDYYQITKTEYENKILLKENAEQPLTTISVQSARSRYAEENKIKCKILGIEPEEETSLALILGMNGIYEESFEEDSSEKENQRSVMESSNNLANKIDSVKENGLYMLSLIKRKEKDEDFIDKKDKPENKKQKGYAFFKNKYAKILIIPSVIFLVLIVFLCLLPGSKSEKNEYMNLSQYYVVRDQNEVVIIYNGKVLRKRGLFADGSTYVTYEFAHTYLNKRLYYDKKEELMIYTTSDSVIEMHKNSKKTDINGKSVQYDIIPYRTTNDGNTWISIDFLSRYSAFKYTEYDNPHRLAITNYSEDTEILSVNVKEDGKIRYRSNTNSPVLKDVKKDQKLILEEQDKTWSKVSSLDGITGYIQSDKISRETEEIIKKNTFEESFQHNTYTGKILMAWHQITNPSANGNIETILKEVKQINVISPTWFYLNDSKGDLADLGSIDYVNTCHKNNVLVWGLVSNLENPDVDTTEILTCTSIRKRLISNIITAAKKYNLDGINIDFEALSIDAGDSYIQFIRELAVQLEHTGIVLSVDNYVPSEYTAFYNREEQAKFADYVIVMAYDEHTGISESSGSTASYPWVKEGLENTLKEVPNKQVILGIPLYTMIWKSYEGKAKPEAVGIESMLKILNDSNADVNWDDNLKQFYATYKDSNGKMCEVWAEETESISYKLNLMRKHNIAGSAFWKLGLEPKNIWNDIAAEYTKERMNNSGSDVEIPETDVNKTNSHTQTDAVNAKKDLEEDIMDESEMGVQPEGEKK